MNYNEREAARELANSTLAQVGPNVIGSARWYRTRAIELAETIMRLLDDVKLLQSEVVGQMEDKEDVYTDLRHVKNCFEQLCKDYIDPMHYPTERIEELMGIGQ